MSSSQVFSRTRAATAPSSPAVTRRSFMATALAWLLFCLLAPFAAHAQTPPPAAAASVIQHKLFLLDEPRKQVLYVDEAAPANNWTLPIEGGPAWSIQLVGGNRLLTAIPAHGGFREYDLATKKVVREKFDKGRYAGAMSAVRLPDGRTVLGCEGRGRRGKPARIYLFDKDDRETAEWLFPQAGSLRLVRATPAGTLLFGSNKDRLFEITLEGKIIREAQTPGAIYNFQVSALPGGHLLASCGYGGFLAELDAKNNVIRKLGGKPEPEGVKFIFMSQFQRLRNGNILVATWTGHGTPDSAKGQQLVEFEPDGKIVWKWHNPALAGSILGVIVADHLDTTQFQPAY